MLTKEHLKYRVRQGRVSPVFMDAEDRAALAVAGELIDLFTEGVGQSYGELEEAALELADDDLGRGLVKLLMDGCEVEDDDGRTAEQRWRILSEAQAIRVAGEAASPQELRNLVMARLQSDPPTTDPGQVLFADLPACRTVGKVKETSPRALLDRYNLAQVQGLLLRARTVKMGVQVAGVAERRELFQQLKFHRLMAQVLSDDRKSGALTFEVSGPLAIFDQAASYGLRLATFFPHLVRFKEWTLEAAVSLKERNLDLRLDHRSGLVSHYQARGRYIPEEFAQLVAAFNSGEEGQRLALSSDFIDIGRESYCFPDFMIEAPDGQRLYLELFHRWHRGALAHRLESVAKAKTANLVVGVSRELATDKELAACLAESEWFRRNGFVFRDFPTPRGLRTALAARADGAGACGKV